MLVGGNTFQKQWHCSSLFMKGLQQLPLLWCIWEQLSTELPPVLVDFRMFASYTSICDPFLFTNFKFYYSENNSLESPWHSFLWIGCVWGNSWKWNHNEHNEACIGIQALQRNTFLGARGYRLSNCCGWEKYSAFLLWKQYWDLCL